MGGSLAIKVAKSNLIELGLRFETRLRWSVV
jgi:hypothetical protein